MPCKGLLPFNGALPFYGVLPLNGALLFNQSLPLFCPFYRALPFNGILSFYKTLPFNDVLLLTEFNPLTIFESLTGFDLLTIICSLKNICPLIGYTAKKEKNETNHIQKIRQMIIISISVQTYCSVKYSNCYKNLIKQSWTAETCARMYCLIVCLTNHN